MLEEVFRTFSAFGIDLYNLEILGQTGNADTMSSLLPAGLCVTRSEELA